MAQLEFFSVGVLWQSYLNFLQFIPLIIQKQDIFGEVLNLKLTAIYYTILYISYIKMSHQEYVEYLSFFFFVVK